MPLSSMRRLRREKTTRKQIQHIRYGTLVMQTLQTRVIALQVKEYITAPQAARQKYVLHLESLHKEGYEKL